MSSNKPKSIHLTELDLAEDEFFAEFEENDEEPSENDQVKVPSLSKTLSSNSNFFKPHDVQAVTSAMNEILAKDCAPPPIMTPSDSSAPLYSGSSSSSSSNNTLKRSFSSQQPDNQQASKVKKLDDDKEFTETNELDSLEDALFAEYLDQEGEEDDASCPNSLDSDSDEDEDGLNHNSDDIMDKEEKDQITCKPCFTTETKCRRTDSDVTLIW